MMESSSYVMPWMQRGLVVIGYERCVNCPGARVVGSHCAVHLDDNEREKYYEKLPESRILNIQETTIDSSLLERLIWYAGGARTDSRRRETIVALLLNEATIRGDLNLNIEVLRYASFESAHFEGVVKMRLEAECPVSFSRAEFDRELDLEGSNFRHMVFFNRTHFRGPASFTSVLVDEYAIFNSPEFEGPVSFASLYAGGLKLTGVIFTKPVSFSLAKLGDDPEDIHEEPRLPVGCSGWWDLIRAPQQALVPLLHEEQQKLLKEEWIPGRGAYLSNVTFSARADFLGLTIVGDQCVIEETRFEKAANLEYARFSLGKRLIISRSQFAERVGLRVESAALDCRSSLFADGAEMDVAADTVAIEDCRFGRYSLIRASGERPPRLLSLRRTDVEHLHLYHLDLSPCRFAEAGNLDKLVIEGPLRMAAPPPPRWATRRRLIADEWHWRAKTSSWLVKTARSRAKTAGWRAKTAGWLAKTASWHMPGPATWHDAEIDPHVDLANPTVLTATEIASIYRALRKGREDKKDEPGAGDFYYGELEMRRLSGQQPDSHDAENAARPTFGAERLVLWLYWAVSGYGLRAARAIIALAVTILLGALALSLWGYPHGQGYGRASLFALESSISLLRAPSQQLTATGEVIQILLRLTGPLFFGLALLSLRGRVKR
jgi:hypothetical protein